MIQTRRAHKQMGFLLFISKRMPIVSVMAIVFQTPEIVQKLLLNAKSLQIEHKHITVIQMVCNKCC